MLNHCFPTEFGILSPAYSSSLAGTSSPSSPILISSPVRTSSYSASVVTSGSAWHSSFWMGRWMGHTFMWPDALQIMHTGCKVVTISGVGSAGQAPCKMDTMSGDVSQNLDRMSQLSITRWLLAIVIHRLSIKPLPTQSLRKVAYLLHLQCHLLLRVGAVEAWASSCF